jgi:hypothetical protein
MPTKKPTLRGTKWLGTIPVEAECTACAGVKFKAIFASHHPSAKQSMKSLKEQFDSHLKQAHGADSTNQQMP